MSVNFPTDRPEAGLGSGPLQQGDSWRFGSIEYTWVITPDGTGIWSSKGINVNPEIYIAKADLFEANGGVISGAYNGGANEFAVSNAATADEAAKVGHQLSLTFQPAIGDAKTITYDGSSTQSITFTDTDIAQDVITISGGTGINVNSDNQISITNSVARANNNYVTNGSGNKLKSGQADSTKGTLTITQGGTQKGTFDGSSNKTINLDSGGTGGNQTLDSVLTEGNTSSYSIELSTAGKTTEIAPGAAEWSFDNRKIIANAASTYGAGIDIHARTIGAESSYAFLDFYLDNTLDVSIHTRPGEGLVLDSNEPGSRVKIIDRAGTSNSKREFYLDPPVAAQNLQSVLNTGWEAQQGNGNTGSIKLYSATAEVALYGNTGVIELTRPDGPFIDFKNSRGEDYDTRIIQENGNNLVLESKTGGVFVNDPVNGRFQLTPATSSGGGGDGSGAVDKVIGGMNIDVSPLNGTGNVTVNFDAGTGDSKYMTKAEVQALISEAMRGY